LGEFTEARLSKETAFTALAKVSFHQQIVKNLRVNWVKLNVVV
jgi:hypothetical protein